MEDSRLLCALGCGQVPESLVESVNDCWSGERCCDVRGTPLVRLLMEGRL